MVFNSLERIQLKLSLLIDQVFGWVGLDPSTFRIDTGSQSTTRTSDNHFSIPYTKISDLVWHTFWLL